jgi:hypothetical protein
MSKDYQRLWKDQLKNLARKNMAQHSLAPPINHDDPESAFDLVVTIIGLGDEDDQTFLKTFRDARLNVEDPFHWWELLHQLIMIHTDRPAGNSRIWTQAKIKKLENDCVRVGRLEPATKVIKKICGRLKENASYKETSENLAFQITRHKLTARIKKKIA